MRYLVTGGAGFIGSNFVRYLFQKYGDDAQVVNLDKLGERTLWIDCDVLEADGGTRTASINGAFIAVIDALDSLKGKIAPVSEIVRDSVAASSPSEHSVTMNSEVEMSIQARPMRSPPDDARARAIASR